MRFLWIMVLFLVSAPVLAEEKTIRIYQDADLSNHKESSRAIQLGIETAFAEINNKIAGHKVEFVYLDHRGNVIRSKLNYEKFLADDRALAIYSGIHSPPLIRNLKFINENGALTLVPWAAGGPITRYSNGKNWVFRLSVDDTRAGPVIINSAMKTKKCKSPHLLLESTPWGDSNLKSMSRALKTHKIDSPKVTRFGWNLSAQGARLMLRDITNTGADCLILVGNAVESITIVRALLGTDAHKQMKVVSHWGLTGGNFHEMINAEKRSLVDLSFIQTCFAFTNEAQTVFSRQVFKRLSVVSKGKIKSAIDLKSAVGFIHAYDLTKIVISAIQQAGLKDDIKASRDLVRRALEKLQKPVRGLVKTYNRPFSTFNIKTNVNAHEALHSEDYCMAHYGPNNEILIDKVRSVER